MSEPDDTEPLGPGEADAALAAEYVLRLLGPDEEREIARRITNDPVFAALVARWQHDLAVWDGEFAAVRPPRGLKAKVERRVFGPRVSPLARAWASAALWRWVALAAGAAAVAMALLAPGSRGPVVPEVGAPRLVSALATLEAGAEFVALIQPGAAVLSLTRVSGAPASGRVHELWYIEDDAAPVSLGVLPDAPFVRVPLGDALAARIGAGTTMAVSEEPVGGSPTGAPTGPVVAAGPVREI